MVTPDGRSLGTDNDVWLAEGRTLDLYLIGLTLLVQHAVIETQWWTIGVPKYVSGNLGL